MVQKTGWSYLTEWVRAWKQKRPVRYCAVICDDCHEVIGWESPIDYKPDLGLQSRGVYR